jgi:hypothetical protein
MSKYYSCRWVMHPVRPRDAFFRLFKAAEELKIEIRLNGVQVDDDGYKFIELVAQTPARNILYKMVEHIGGKIGLNTWLEVDESAFVNGEKLDVTTAKDLGDATQVYGKANDKRKKKRDEKKKLNTEGL